MTKEHRWIIDSIEEGVASIEVDGNTMINVPQALLPATAKEGDVLRVTIDRPPKGSRAMLTVDVDSGATKQALSESAQQLSKARSRKDPGGDIKL
jgi:hypothetical protein